MTNVETNHPIRVSALLLSAVVFALGVVIPVHIHSSAEERTESLASAADARYAELSAALSEDDWFALKSILAEIRVEQPLAEPCDEEAPLRFLRGHAALATGANTEAVSCFYCACDSVGSKSLSTWMSWVNKLISDHRTSPSASMRYLRGDALARSRELQEAIREFNVALSIDSGFVPALNARGVSKWLLFEADSSMIDYRSEAVGDFVEACDFAPEFADAWANKGLVALQDPSEPDRAKSLFDMALSIDSTYWLALNGKAVSAGTAGEYGEFESAILRILVNEPNTPFMPLNSGAYGVTLDPDARNAQQATSYGRNVDRVYLHEGQQGVIALVEDDIADLIRSEWARTMPETSEMLRRGGIFMRVRDGKDIRLAEDGSPILSATWFALNYPLAAAEANAEE